ncbi:PHD finger protein 20-like, partial [Scleropages formosus]
VFNKYTMTRPPPNRRGITFEVGAPLEARDSLKNWYPASIEKIDYEEERVLIHYRQWSHRYDEWFDWSSPYLRPVDRIQLRREGLKENSSRSVRVSDRRITPLDETSNLAVVFHVNEKVLASWSDCRFYPAKVLSVNKDASYTVKFFDGVVQTVKEIHVKPFFKDKKGGKSRSQDKKGDKQVVRKQLSEKDRKPLGNVGSAQENGHVKNRRIKSTVDHDEDSGKEDEGEEQENGDGSEKKRLMLGSEDMAEVECEKPAREGDHMRELSQKPEVRDGKINQAASGEVNCMVDCKSENESWDCTTPQGVMEIQAKESISEPPAMLKAVQEKTPTEHHSQSSRRQTRFTRGSAESKSNATTDPSDQKLCQSDMVTSQPAGSVGEREAHGVSDQLEVPYPAKGNGQAPPVQVYRVVKNQPPPVLSINLDHNPFKCKAPGCLKSFRKAKLLHYHVKYYHGGDKAAEGELSPTRSIQTRASERQMMALESPRTRRSTSASFNSSLQNSHRNLQPSRTARQNERKRTLASPSASGVSHRRPSLLGKSDEDQVKSRSRPTEGEHGVVHTEKDRGRLKERKHIGFLHIKLKKKKRKKSKSDEDSGSNWSADSPIWSEEELDISTPSQVQEADLCAKDSEVVSCICEVQEENNFMIQCEECLTWQHTTCMGLTEDNVPETYFCHMCRGRPGRRQSLHYWCDWDWLSNGHMYGLSFLEENYSHQNAKKIVATHQLLGDVHHVLQVLSSLRLKIDILQSHSHHDLKLWCQPWKRADWPRKKGGTENGVVPSVTIDLGLEQGSGAVREASADRDALNHGPPVQDSYISSEHCYQKPRTYYPAVEQRLVVETRPSELEDSLRSTEDLLALEHCYGGPLDPEWGKIHPSLQFDQASHTKADCCKKLCLESGCEDRIEKMEAGEADGHLQQQWQMNLLEHIEALQEEVTHRMDFIEKELDVLESWLDCTGELEPPEPLARLPQLKHRVKQLLAELAKVQQIALCCST